MDPTVIAYSIMKTLQTMGKKKPDQWFILNHAWPIDRDRTSRLLYSVKAMIEIQQIPSFMLQLEVNRGGHNGFSHVMEILKPGRDDLVLGIDPDTNPVTEGWFDAMVDVMQAGQSYSWMSLLHNHIAERNWQVEFVAGHKVVSLPHPEMFNCTMWRGEFVQNGLKALSPYYGGVEVASWRENTKKSGYLYDFREDLNPVPHHPEYNAWKAAAAHGGYPKNFDQWCQEKGIK